MNYTIYFLVPFVLSLIFTPIIRTIAIKNSLIAYPRADRWHKKPTAILGGVSIYLSSIISILFLNPQYKNMWGFFLGGAILFVTGLIDDKFHLAPYTKLFIQIVAGCIVIFSGIVLGLPLSNFLAIPLTLLWIVGVTNSFNLLDNIDGLAAGIAAISSLMLFFSSLIFSNNPLGIYGIILSGAALGFLPFNFNPAKIFLGDSGSMFLGYSLAVITISGTTP
ncbi:MAG: MraY family glycosyltransferase, partial [Candidatus Omnitrophica bacterium]|nr:MraY family glycosyltransferase [Candidatus Omnitrophota bacterium]